MPSPEKKQALLDAVTQLRSAELLLLDESRATSDVGRLIQINTEYTHLDSCMSQMLHAQALADDAEFNGATAALKTQAAALQLEQQDIRKIVANVENAARIVGYVGRAAQIIAAL